METIELRRTSKAGKAVRGLMFISFDGHDYGIQTLENSDFIIPAGTYDLKKTWSPRFKKMMPEVLNVPDRTGIRIHRGTVPEHSEGCILMDDYGCSVVNAAINFSAKFLEQDTLQLKIIDSYEKH